MNPLLIFVTSSKCKRLANKFVSCVLEEIRQFRIKVCNRRSEKRQKIETCPQTNDWTDKFVNFHSFKVASNQKNVFKL